MASGHGPDEQRVELFLGNLLRWGVLLAAAVVLVGAAIYLARHGREPAVPGETAEVREELRHPVGIVREALVPLGRAVVQLGLLFLIATPVARVGFSVVVFLRQRDGLFVGITLLVLAVLLFSLFLGHQAAP